MTRRTATDHIALRSWHTVAVALIASMVLVLCSCADEREGKGEFLERSVELYGVTYRYQVFVPARRFGGKRPVVVFLHGKGELGYDGRKPTLVGLGPHLRANADTFPAIAVFPQAPDNTQWTGEVSQIALLALDATLLEFDAEPDRVYLTGLSMGALGTWLIGLEHPGRFAALVPVCNSLLARSAPKELDAGADGSPHVAWDPLLSAAPKLRDMPIWIFHGGQDDVVPPLHARRMFEILKSEKAVNVRYTEFPHANHNCWDSAYAGTSELWPWLFAQQRSPRSG